MTTRANNLFGRSNVLRSEHVGGEVRITIGDAQDKEGEAQQMPMWGMPGFVSMPDDPDDNGGACQVLYANDGPRSIALGFRENRLASKSGNPKPGDRMITTSGNARVLLKKADDAVTMYTANEPDGGSSMIITQNGKTGVTTIVNGKALMTMKTDEIILTAGGSSLKIDAGGIVIFGKHAALNCGGGNLGMLGPGPPPQGVSSILAGPSGIIGAPSTRWTISLALVLAINIMQWIWCLRGTGAPPT